MICMGDNDSVGEDNPYGHPTVQTLNALQQHGLPYVRLRYTYGQGALKPLTRGLIHVSVKGGTLLGLGNGCPYNDTGYLTSSTDTYYGESLAIVRPDGSGPVQVAAESPLGSAQTEIPWREEGNDHESYR